MLRIIRKCLHPIAQLRLMHPQLLRVRARSTPAPTARSLSAGGAFPVIQRSTPCEAKLAIVECPMTPTIPTSKESSAEITLVGSEVTEAINV